MEGDPHALIEAMAISAFAIGAQKGFIYLRAEYPDAGRVLQHALVEARSAGVIGENIFHSGFSFDIDLITGRGSYICGEETALLNSIECRRPEVRSRPPYPTERGLFQKPTLVNNVETLAAIPWIMLNGGEAYRALGFSTSRGTKLVSLNSLFHRPGLYEIEFGIPVRTIIEEIGGGLKAGRLKGVIIGGPLAGIIPPHLLDTPFGFDELHSIGASVGHGGVIAFDEHTSITELIDHVFAFGAYESCGKCTPCRVGSRRIETIYERVLKMGGASAEEREECEEIISALAQTSLCGLGTGLADFARSAAHYYPEEFNKCFARV
jgi:NADH:ubiquinone oxidoreductase subunit F (NADH-binding)